MKTSTAARDAFVVVAANNCPHQFIGIEQCTPVKLKKTGNPLDGREVCKYSKLNVRLNGNYTKQARRETGNSEFVAQPRAWGERVGESCIIRHNDNFYLEYFCMNVLESGYMIDGVHATPEQVDIIREFLPKRKKTTNAGVSTDTVRCVNVENIISVKMNGKNYILD